MKTVIIVYVCDAWHSQQSKSFFGVYSTKTKAIAAAKKHGKLSPSSVSSLSSFNQTQGLDENYILDEATVNPK